MWDFNEKKRTNQKKKYYKVKEKYIITRSEEAIISRSLKGLIKKGFLIQTKKWGKYYLTKEGFLKANKFDTCDIFVSFKEYKKNLEEREQKQEQEQQESYKKLVEDCKSIMKKS